MLHCQTIGFSPWAIPNPKNRVLPARRASNCPCAIKLNSFNAISTVSYPSIIRPALFGILWNGLTCRNCMNRFWLDMRSNVFVAVLFASVAVRAGDAASESLKYADPRISQIDDADFDALKALVQSEGATARTAGAAVTLVLGIKSKFDDPNATLDQRKAAADAYWAAWMMCVRIWKLTTDSGAKSKINNAVGLFFNRGAVDNISNYQSRY